MRQCDCGQWFMPKRVNQVFCSPACYARFHNSRQRRGGVSLHSGSKRPGIMADALGYLPGSHRPSCHGNGMTNYGLPEYARRRDDS